MLPLQLLKRLIQTLEFCRTFPYTGTMEMEPYLENVVFLLCGQAQFTSDPCLIRDPFVLAYFLFTCSLQASLVRIWFGSSSITPTSEHISPSHPLTLPPSSTYYFFLSFCTYRYVQTCNTTSSIQFTTLGGRLLIFVSGQHKTVMYVLYLQYK